MKKLYIFLIVLMMMFSLSSCETYTYATTQDDIYVETEGDVVRSNVSFDVIIQYGTPYYRDGVLLYYLYRDIYYYPFYYNNYWYVRAYRRPFIHFNTRPYFRPHRYDYRFSPGHYRGFDRPNRPIPHYRHNPNMRRPDYPPRQPRPDVGNRRPNQPRINGNRPQRPPQIRPNTRTNQLRIDRNQNNHSRGGNFGGRR
jgi:hypothetical protein